MRWADLAATTRRRSSAARRRAPGPRRSILAEWISRRSTSPSEEEAAGGAPAKTPRRFPRARRESSRDRAPPRRRPCPRPLEVEGDEEHLDRRVSAPLTLRRKAGGEQDGDQDNAEEFGPAYPNYTEATEMRLLFEFSRGVHRRVGSDRRLLDLALDLALREAVPRARSRRRSSSGPARTSSATRNEDAFCFCTELVLNRVGNVRQAAGAHLVEVLLVPPLPVAARLDLGVLQDAEAPAELGPARGAQADPVPSCAVGTVTARCCQQPRSWIARVRRAFLTGDPEWSRRRGTVVRVDELRQF